MRPAVTRILATSRMTITLIMITVESRVVKMRVATPYQDYKKEAVMIVVVIETECIVTIIILTIFQQPCINLFHKVLTQDL